MVGQIYRVCPGRVFALWTYEMEGQVDREAVGVEILGVNNGLRGVGASKRD